MMTDRDIVCKGLAQDNFDAHDATARDVMTAEIYCCRDDDDLAKAVRHMEELKVSQVAGHQQEQTHGRHSQSWRRQPFGINRSAIGMDKEYFRPSLRLL